MDPRKALLALREGEQVVAVGKDGGVIRGLVDETAPHLGLMWIREDKIGARHLVVLADLHALQTGPATPGQ